MDEKIKISLAKSTLGLLQKDCLDFRVVKENGASNFNAFINMLVANYYEQYTAHEESLHEQIKQALSIVPPRYTEKAFEEVVKIFAKSSQVGEEKKNTTTFSFKPTKVSEKAVFYISQVLLQSQSLSSFYRRMFESYAQKPKNERERIIFKENYDLLVKAIKKGVTICMQFKKGKVFNNVSPYAVSHGKDELFNYLLYVCNGKNNTIRLSSIKSISLLTGKSVVSEENKAMFDRQIECGAQYPIYSTDNEPIKVQLSDKGKTMFDKIYLYRPVPTSIEGDVYTFNCSGNQILYYFERFGSEALILSPRRLGIYMRNYYHFANKVYKNIYRGEN